MYKLVIFDFDGTLADTFPWAMGIIDQICDKYKFKRLERNDLDELRGYDALQILKYFGVPRWKIPMVGKHVRSIMAKDTHRLSLFEGIDQLLTFLVEQGITLAVVSSNSKQIVSRVLGPENADRIQYFECGVPLFGKQTKFKKILKKSRVQPDEAICIGDEIRDILAAKRVNIPFGAVSWGYTKVEALQAHSPEEVFTSIGDIAEKVAFGLT